MTWTTKPDAAISGLARTRALRGLKVKRDLGWHLVTSLTRIRE